MRVAGLKDLKKTDDEDDGKRNEFFAGGLDQRGGGSGLAVVGPPRGGPPAGGLDGLVAAAKAQQEQEADMAPSPNTITITLYRNGFTVDDGPLRDPQAPENMEFLNDLNRGKIPREIRALKGNGPVDSFDVALSDKRGEDYVAPPYVAFGGTANVLSSSSAASSSSSFSAAAVSSIPGPSSEGSMINIQVRTHDNKRLKIRISGTATVNQLAAQILRDIGNTDNTLRFALSAGFPPKDLTDGNKTVTDAGLSGASVTMKKI